MAVIESVWFNGVEYRRYPESDRRTDRVYYTATGGERLHRAVWKAHHGTIPDGWHVHHADHDPLNNAIENLDCKPASDHLSEHSREPEHVERARGWINKIRPLASAWHGSPAGKAWHAEHARQAYKSRVPLQKKCDQCFADFDSMGRRETDRFCSNGCKSAWRRASGVDDVTRDCAMCGAQFTCNKYRKTSHCSRSCGKRKKR